MQFLNADASTHEHSRLLWHFNAFCYCKTQTDKIDDYYFSYMNIHFIFST